MEPLHELVPFQAAVIHLFDPDGNSLVQVISQGCGTTVNQYFTEPVIPRAIEVLGFRGGLTVGLFHRDGHHLGVLGLYTDTVAQPTAAVRDLLSALAPVIATALDPLRSVGVVTGLVADAYAGIVLTRAGKPWPLPALPGHVLLADGSDLLAVAVERVTTGHLYGSFLCPDSADQSSRPIMITMLACPADSPDVLLAVVLLSPPGELHGLTSRELEILGLLVEGWPNRRIATALFLAPRTVSTHLEHILTKLGAPTRTLAAVRAQRLGLYIPRPLNGIGREIPRS